MSLSHSPKIVTNGLTMFLDPQNIKSYQISKNLLPYSNIFTNYSGYCSGNLSNLTTNTSDVTDPIGTNTATKISIVSNACDGSNSLGFIVGRSPIKGSTKTYTASIYIRGAVGGEIVGFGFSDSRGATYTLTTSWQRISFTWIPPVITNYDADRAMQLVLGTANSTVYVYGAQLELGPIATTYYPTNGQGGYWYNSIDPTMYCWASGDGIPWYINHLSEFDYTENSPAVTSGAYTGRGWVLNQNPIPTTGSFTITAMIKRNTSEKALGDRETILSNTGWADGYRFGINSTTDLYALIGGANAAGYQESGLGLNAPITDGNWHYVAGVFDRAAQLGSYKIYGYVDDKYSSSVNINAGAGGNVAFPVGANFGPGYGGCCDVFAGHMGPMITYNRALSSSEIVQNFNALRGRYGI